MTSGAIVTLVAALGATSLQGCAPDPALASAGTAPPITLARGVIDVDGGLLAIRPSRSGHLVVIAGTLGQDVAQGTILARLNDDSQEAEVAVARADVQRARAELASVRSQRARLQEQVGRVREAVTLGAESGRTLDELQTQLDTQTSAIPIAKAALSSAEAHLRAAREIAATSEVRVPVDGRIVQVNARIGEVVGTTDGAPLFLLRPHRALIVRASLAERDVEHVHIGTPVSIEPVDGAGSYRGHVGSLGELARKPDATSATDDFMGDRIVDCIIDLDTGSPRIGSLVVVRFEPRGE